MTSGPASGHAATAAADPSGTHRVVATAGATFEAARDELVGDRPLRGSAEIARSYCAVADRLASIVAVTPGRIRRVDCWLGGVGFVTHAAATDPAQPLLGSVCDRARAAELTASLVASLVGGLPDDRAAGPVDLGAVGEIAPGSLPGGVDWVAIVSATEAGSLDPPERIAVASDGGGLALAALGSLHDESSVSPAAPGDLERHLERLVGPAPTALSDLLADDGPRPPDANVLAD